MAEHPDVALRSITDDNREAVAALRVAPSQQRFVSTVTDSLAEAAEHPGARAVARAICEGDAPVGFVMFAEDVDGDEYVANYLWKLLVDARHQRRGIGTATLDLVAAHFRARPGVEVLTTSAGQGDGSPIAFYERYGFARTGEVSDGEVVLQLRL